MSDTTTAVENLPSNSGDGSTDPPVCCDVLDAETINRWFEYWEYQSTKDGCGRCAETIRKIRRMALAGAKKGRKNNAAVAEVIAGILYGMANDMRAGKIRIR